MKPSLLFSGLLGVALATTALAAPADEGPSADKSADAAPAPMPIPTTCGAEGAMNSTKLCMPERSYAKKLCSGVYPEVALGLFAKGTPFSRIYLAGDVEAWNASGGRTSRAKLAFDEEVLVLAKNGAVPSGGIVMTNAQSSYDVLRWDGSCVSVMDGEVTTKRPPAPKPAELAWSRLEENTRRALLEIPKVKTTYAALNKQCTLAAGDSLDRKGCDKAVKTFNQAIVDAVRAGATLPAPGRRPS